MFAFLHESGSSSAEGFRGFTFFIHSGIRLKKNHGDVTVFFVQPERKPPHYFDTTEQRALLENQDYRFFNTEFLLY